MSALLTHGIAHEARHALRDVVPDPGTQPPVCDEHEFATIVETMVADEAPRLFAVVQEYGDRAEIVGHRLRMSVRDPECALHMFTVGGRIRAHLVWFNQDAATPICSEADGE